MSFVTAEVDELHCMAEPPDTRLIFQAKQAADTGFNYVVIQSCDTDVLVLAVYF